MNAMPHPHRRRRSPGKGLVGRAPPLIIPAWLSFIVAVLLLLENAYRAAMPVRGTSQPTRNDCWPPPSWAWAPGCVICCVLLREQALNGNPESVRALRSFTIRPLAVADGLHRLPRRSPDINVTTALRMAAGTLVDCAPLLMLGPRSAAPQ